MRFLLMLLARPLTYVVMGAGILLLDLFTGPVLKFPILFVLPVALSAWFCNVRLAYTLAGSLPLGTFLIGYYMDAPTDIAAIVINMLIRMFVLGLLAFFAATVVRLNRLVKVLRGRLPICMWCKSIRKVDGTWEKLEKYISDHSEADFTHGLCPVCMKNHYGEWMGKKKSDPSPSEVPTA